MEGEAVWFAWLRAGLGIRFFLITRISAIDCLILCSPEVKAYLYELGVWIATDVEIRAARGWESATEVQARLAWRGRTEC